MKTYKQLMRQLSQRLSGSTDIADAILSGSYTDNMNLLDGALGDISALSLPVILTNVIKSQTGTGMTNAAKEEIDYATNAQFELWKKTQSMPAQVASYQEAGLNPMLLANGSGVGSTPGAASPSGGSFNLIGSLLGFLVDNKRVKNDYDIRSRQLDLEKDKLQMYKDYYGTLNRLNLGRAIGQENENSVFSIRREGLIKDNALKDKNLEQIDQWMQESISRMSVNDAKVAELFSAANLQDKQAAVAQVQEAILAAQEKYSDRYFKAVAEISEAQAYLNTFESAAVKRFYEKRMQAAEAELNLMINTATEKENWINGEAWRRICQGKMNTKERTQLWTDVVSGVVKTGLTAGAIYGVGALRAASARAFPGFTLPGTMNRDFVTSGPYM